MIKSYSDKQDEILKAILKLNNIERFDADISYGNGSFYKNVPEPHWKSDVDPRVSVNICSSDSLPVENGAFDSVIFDPPFLTYVKNAREHNSIMAKRFGGYWRYEELIEHYKRTICEVHRVLYTKGIFVFKCQDIIHNHRMHSTHINVINWCEGLFRLKDLFVLIKNNRMPIPPAKGYKPKQQKHARIHHSYFLVLEKL